jgi:hypothetical protein
MPSAPDLRAGGVELVAQHEDQLRQLKGNLERFKTVCQYDTKDSCGIRDIDEP